jgi:hypothetical protein
MELSSIAQNEPNGEQWVNISENVMQKEYKGTLVKHASTWIP